MKSGVCETTDGPDQLSGKGGGLATAKDSGGGGQFVAKNAQGVDRSRIAAEHQRAEGNRHAASRNRRGHLRRGKIAFGTDQPEDLARRMSLFRGIRRECFFKRRGPRV